jgi:two-component system sensor histidine kinase TctE
VPPECLLDGNPTLLKELVRNLVDNAINYTPSGAW